MSAERIVCLPVRKEIYSIQRKSTLGGGLYDANRFLIPISRHIFGWQSICVKSLDVRCMFVEMLMRAMSRNRKRKFVLLPEMCQMCSRNYFLIDIHQPLYILKTFEVLFLVICCFGHFLVNFPHCIFLDARREANIPKWNGIINFIFIKLSRISVPGNGFSV